MADHPKAQPYTFDLTHLLCTDPNPLPSLTTASNSVGKEAILASTARDCAQALINQLLTTCPISRSTDDGALQITLPAPSTATMQLPREKPVLKEKEKSRWERFAEKKGIKAKRKDGKLVYDEGKGEWVPRYGFKGKRGVDGGAGDNWLVEVDEKTGKGGKEGTRGGGDGTQKGGGRKKARKAR